MTTQSALADLRASYRAAAPEARREMRQLVFAPWPTWTGNVLMYVNILIHLFVVFGVAGLSFAFAREQIIEFYGGGIITTVLFYVIYGDVMISTLVNRVGSTLLKGIEARKQHEMRRFAREARERMQNMLDRLNRGEITPEDLMSGTIDLSRPSKSNKNNPVAHALEHLDAQDRAMTDQETRLKEMHNGDIDPIKNLLKQLEENDRKQNPPE